MAMLNSDDANATGRSTWIDPTIVTLDVADTANKSGRGGDGGRNPDCSKS